MSRKIEMSGIVTEKPENCPICFDSLESQKTHTVCGHWFHDKCMEQQVKCPMCRYDFSHLVDEEFLVGMIMVYDNEFVYDEGNSDQSEYGESEDENSREYDYPSDDD